MIDGIYTVKAKTPLGRKEGMLVAVTSGSTCLAELTVGKRSKRLEGTVQNDVVTFEGSIKLPSPIGQTNFLITGTVEGDELKALCTTKKFKFDIAGTRVA